MKNQVLHTVWCNISGEAAGEIWHWSLLGVKGLNITFPSFPTARLSEHKFPSRGQEAAALIYQHSPVFCDPDVTLYEQCYIF